MLQPFLLPRGTPIPPALAKTPAPNPDPVPDSDVPVGHLSDSLARLVVGERLGWWNSRPNLRSLDVSESEADTDSLVEGGSEDPFDREEGDGDVDGDEEEEEGGGMPWDDEVLERHVGGGLFGVSGMGMGVGETQQGLASGDKGLEELFGAEIRSGASHSTTKVATGTAGDGIVSVDSLEALLGANTAEEQGEDKMMRDLFRFGDDVDEEGNVRLGGLGTAMGVGVGVGVDGEDDDEEEDGDYVGDDDSGSSSGSESDDEDEDDEDEEEQDGDGDGDVMGPSDDPMADLDFGGSSADTGGHGSSSQFELELDAMSGSASAGGEEDSLGASTTGLVNRTGVRTISLDGLGQGGVARVETRAGKRTVVFGGSWGI